MEKDNLKPSYWKNIQTYTNNQKNLLGETKSEEWQIQDNVQDKQKQTNWWIPETSLVNGAHSIYQSGSDKKFSLGKHPYFWHEALEVSKVHQEV